MLKKKSSSKPAVRRGEYLYEAFSSKIVSSALGKKAADKETTSHTPLVAQMLVKLDKAVTFEKVLEAVKETKRYKSKNITRCVRGDLAILVREGLAKATKIEAAQKANGSAKKRIRKPRAAKPRTSAAETATQAAEATA